MKPHKFSNERKNSKPHKSHLQYRFDVVKRKINKMFKFKHQKQSMDELQFETDCAYLVKHIEDYGFRFYPNHFIRDDICTLERLLSDFE